MFPRVLLENTKQTQQNNFNLFGTFKNCNLKVKSHVKIYLQQIAQKQRMASFKKNIYMTIKIFIIYFLEYLPRGENQKPLLRRYFCWAELLKVVINSECVLSFMTTGTNCKLLKRAQKLLLFRKI